MSDPTTWPADPLRFMEPRPLEQEHCVYCGRQMVETIEAGLFDRRTGQRQMRVWRSCPRWFIKWSDPRTWLHAFGTHESGAPGTLIGRVRR